MKRRDLVPSLFVGWLLTAFASLAFANAPGRPAPDFTLVDADGQVVRLSDFQGTPVVLNAWATWCPFCIEEIPLFQRAHGDLNRNGSEAVAILLVNLAEEFEVARAFLDEEVGTTLRGFFDATDEHRALHAGIAFDNTRNVLTRSYRVRGMPTTFFIDAEGVVQSVQVGFLSQSLLSDHLAKIGISWSP